MDRSLSDILAIYKELRAIYEPIAGKPLSTVQAIVVAGQVLATLDKHNVTLAELEQLLAEVGPLLTLLT